MNSPQAPTADTRHDRAARPGWLLALLVFVIACAGMSRIVPNDFVDLDDSLTLYANPLMNPPSGQTLRYYWTHPQHGLYIPGTYTTWAALASIARTDQPDLRGIELDPRIFHAASVFFHATAAVVLFLLLHRVFDRQKESPEPPTRLGWSVSALAAAAGAILFALHPVQVESVAWASGLKDVLSGLFALLAIWQYVVAVQSQACGRQWLHWSLATLAFAWAMLCKPSAVMVPALVCVIDLLILRRSWKQTARWTAPWWPMALACVVIARIAQTPSTDVAPLWLRPLVALDALAFYIGKLALPISLGIDYGRSPIVALDRGWLYLTWIAPLALAALLLWKPRRELLAGGLLTGLSVAPVLGLTPFTYQEYTTVTDHYLYLALIGPAVGLAWALTRYPLARPIACIVLALFAVKSIAQAKHWRDDQALFSHALSINPESFLAYNNLGCAFNSTGDALLAAANLAEQAGDRLTALTCRAQATENFRQAAPLFETGIEKRKQARRGVDAYLVAHLNLAVTRTRLGQHEQAIAHRERAVALIRQQTDAHQRARLPGVYYLMSLDYLALDRPQDALSVLEEASRIDPANPAIAHAADEARRALAALPLN